MSGPTITTLVSFSFSDIYAPFGSLILDANGDLFGTVNGGGTYGDGAVFEIINTTGGYASSYTTLTSFDGTDGSQPAGSLIMDANGDLFGTTSGGGAYGWGAVFEIASSAGGYASTPTVLASFNYTDGSLPQGSLITDANGDLFGTTQLGGAYGDGTVFEIANGATTPTVLVSFDGANGDQPMGSLIADANGDLFGTTESGGANQAGTVFEIAKTANGYASTPTTLITFNGTNGDQPLGSLVMDANGDLFGTTASGGADGGGTVFEIVKTTSGYASTPTVLVSFNYTNGADPVGSLLIDANGDLFGTAEAGGADGGGTVFEIANTSGGYASTPTTLITFNGTNGSAPSGSLTADANGDLFGTTQAGGVNDAGTVFEITDSGFVENPVCFLRGTLIATTDGDVAIESLRPGDEVSTTAGSARIRWVGRRAYDGRFINGNHLALPVTLRAGALGENIPARDLHVSPGHGIWLEGALVPAWRLINGVSIVQASSVETVEYFNVELETHGLLMAHGAPVESFLDDGEFRNQFQNVAEYWALYPDAPLCRDITPLPRLESGFALAEIQARVNARAGIIAESAAPGPLRGYVDIPGNDGWVHGWAQDMDHPESPVILRIYAHGRYIARVLANLYRRDLREAGLGSGCHGFACRVPPGCVGVVDVRRESDGAILSWTDTALATQKSAA